MNTKVKDRRKRINVIASNATSEALLLLLALPLSSLHTTIPHTSLSPKKQYFEGCACLHSYATRVHAGYLRDTHIHANKCSKKYNYSQINDELRYRLVV